MRLATRIGQLLRSDAHGILDQLEERSLLLKQHLRDAEIALDHKRTRTEVLEEEQRIAREQLERLDAQASALDEDVDLALAGGREELARFALRKLLPIRDAKNETQTRIKELATSRDRLGEALAEQEQAFDVLRARVEAQLAESRRAQPQASASTRVVADEEIELELLRRSRAAAQVQQ